MIRLVSVFRSRIGVYIKLVVPIKVALITKRRNGFVRFVLIIRNDVNRIGPINFLGINLDDVFKRPLRRFDFEFVDDRLALIGLVGFLR